MVAKDDSYGCAKYAKEHNLLDTAGWKCFKRLTGCAKKMNRMAKQAALASKRTGPLYMFGVCAPKTEQEARKLDAIYLAKNIAPRWRNAKEHEIGALNEYDSFKDNGRTHHLRAINTSRCSLSMPLSMTYVTELALLLVDILPKTMVTHTVASSHLRA